MSIGIQSKIVLDTNLLLLLLVGLTNKKWILTHKRTRQFTIDDFDLLYFYLDSAKELIVTPNVLTETYNLLMQSKGQSRTDLLETYKNFITKSQEHYFESKSAIEIKEFPRVGLTDTGLLELSQDRLLLTVDLDLYLSATERKINVINFNHLKNENM